MLPEIHNIITKWNKEAGVESTGIKIKEVKDKDFHISEVIISIFTDRPGLLIGKGGYLIDKYRKEIFDFYKENHPKLHPPVEIQITELNEIVGQEEIDIDKYYNCLCNHIFGNE